MSSPYFLFVSKKILLSLMTEVLYIPLLIPIVISSASCFNAASLPVIKSLKYLVLLSINTFPLASTSL